MRRETHILLALGITTASVSCQTALPIGGALEAGAPVLRDTVSDVAAPCGLCGKTCGAEEACVSGSCLPVSFDAGTPCGGIMCRGTCQAGQCTTNIYYAPMDAGFNSVTFNLAVDDTHAYFLSSATGKLEIVTLADGSTTEIDPHALPWGALVVDATNAYFAVTEPLFMPPLRIVKQPLCGGPATTLFTQETSNDATFTMALSGSNLYWTSPGSVVRIPIEGGAATTLISGESGNGLLAAVDDEYVYYASSVVSSQHAYNNIVRIPQAGGEPVTLAAMTQIATGIAVQDGYVYWSDLVPRIYGSEG